MLERASVILCTSLNYKPLFLTMFCFISLKTPEELDDSDFETEDFDSRSKTSVQTEDDQLIAGQSARVSPSVFFTCLRCLWRAFKYHISWKLPLFVTLQPQFQYMLFLCNKHKMVSNFSWKRGKNIYIYIL